MLLSTLLQQNIINISMKLNEIELRRDLESNDPKLILKKYGWNVLGSGYEGAVASHPNKPYVLKLFERDSLYKMFLVFCRENQGNIHLPKFFTGKEAAAMTSVTPVNELYSSGKDTRISDIILELPKDTGLTQLSAVRMEKLTPVSENLLKFKYFPELCVLLLISIPNNIRGMSPELQESTLKRMKKLLGAESSDILAMSKDRSKWDKLWEAGVKKPDQSWIDIVDKMIAFSKTNKLGSMDLHDSNLMRRNDILVIIDPFV